MSELDRCLKALEQIGMQRVQKSMTDGRPRSAKIMKALALAEATKTPAGAVLARRILQLEQQETLRKSFGAVAKSMGLAPAPADDDSDEWSSYFSPIHKTDEEDLLEELRELREKEAEVIRQIKEKRHLGED